MKLLNQIHDLTIQTISIVDGKLVFSVNALESHSLNEMYFNLIQKSNELDDVLPHEIKNFQCSIPLVHLKMALKMGAKHSDLHSIAFSMQTEFETNYGEALKCRLEFSPYEFNLTGIFHIKNTNACVDFDIPLFECLSKKTRAKKGKVPASVLIEQYVKFVEMLITLSYFPVEDDKSEFDITGPLLLGEDGVEIFRIHDRFAIFDDGQISKQRIHTDKAQQEWAQKAG